MNHETNPFVEADSDRHAIWEMLVHRDIDAFIAADWSIVDGDFAADRFSGLHAHLRKSPDSWRLDFPTLEVYRDEWLRQSSEAAKTGFAEPLRDAMFRVTTMRDIDLDGDRAVAHKKFDGTVAKSDGTVDMLNWQTLYFCGRIDGQWKITGFVGYLPHSF